MKLKTLLLIITPIIFLLTGCNNVSSAVHSEETVPATTEIPVEVVEVAEPEQSPPSEPEEGEEVANNTEQVSEAVEEEEPVNQSENAEIEELDKYSCLDGRVHITRNEDGTFSYTDEYIGALAMYNYFDGMTEAEIKEKLNLSLAYELTALDGQKTDLYISSLIRLKDIIPQSTPVESNTNTSNNESNSGNNVTGNSNNNSGNTENNNPGNTGNNNSSGNNNVPSQSNSQAEDNGFDSLIQNPDGTLTSPDGTFTFSNPEEILGGEHTYVSPEEIEAFINQN